MDGYCKPFRLDRNANGGGVMVYINKNIPSKHLRSIKISEDIEIVIVEINFKKRKWILLTIYRPPSQSADFFFEHMKIILNHYMVNYTNVIIIGDFNLQPSDDNG